MVPVSHLPDLCLKALFRQMTLEDQMTARNVCRQWNALVLEVTRNRRTLAILMYSASNCHCDHNKWNSLKYIRLNEATVQKIVRTYSAIAKLQLVLTTGIDHQSTFNMFVRLLEHWQKTLVTVYFTEDKCQIGWQAPPGADHFLTALNALPALQYLKLMLTRMQVGHLPILGQLKKIEVSSKSSIDPPQFATMLARYITESSPLVSIHFSSALFEDSPNPALAQLPEHIRDRFVQLDFLRAHDHLAVICTHFRFLTRLKLYPNDLTFCQLFGHLVQLTKLTYLRLDIDFAAILPDSEEDKDDLLAQLQSVKMFHLTAMRMDSHEEVSRLKLTWTMPNLKRICLQFCGDFPLERIQNNRCTICGLANFSSFNLRANREAAKGCLCAIFAPLKRQNSKLPVIEYEFEHIFGTAEELLAE